MEVALQYGIDAISLGCLYAVITLGISLTFGIMNLANFAYGEIIMVTGYVLLALETIPVGARIIGALLTAVALAVAMERVAFRPLRGANANTLMVSSFAVSVFLQNLFILTIGSRPRSVDFGAGLAESVAIGGIRVPKIDFVTVAAAAVLLGGFALFLRRTALGVQLRAAAEDFQMTRVLGVRANRVLAATFAASGLMAGVASLLFVSQTGTLTPTMGLQPVLVGFVGAVIGGLTSLKGGVIGGLAFGILTTVLTATLPGGVAPYRDAFAFAAVIVLLSVRPEGLAGPAIRRRV